MASENQVKEAVDFSRRNNLRLLVVVSGLLLAWGANLEGGHRIAQTFVIQSRETSVQLENLSNALKSFVDTRNKTVAKVELATPGQGKAERQKLLKVNKKIESIYVAKKETVDAAAALKAALNEKVTFDVGGGLKLPFAFSTAPIVWMAVFLYLQISSILARAAYWRLMAIPVSMMSEEDRKRGSFLTTDVPLWLYPLPIFDTSFAVPVDGAATAIGLSAQRQRLVTIGQRLAVLIASLVALRVFFIGTFLYGQVLPETISGLVLDLLFGLSIAAAAWSLRAPRVIPDLPERAGVIAFDRRSFLALSVGCVATAYAAGTGLVYVFAKTDSRVRTALREIYRYYTPRLRTRCQVSLASGFYQHRRSKRIYFVQADGVVFGGGPQLKAANLRAIAVELAIPSGSVSGSKVSLRDLSRLASAFEDEAIRRATNLGPESGFRLIYLYIYAFQVRGSARPPIQQIDLAAGLAIRYGLEDRLAELISLCRFGWLITPQLTALSSRSSGKPPDYATLPQGLGARFERWTS